MEPDGPPFELSEDEDLQIGRELARRKRVLVRNGIVVLLCLGALPLLGVPLWIVAGLILLHGAGWAYLYRHHQRTVQAARAAGWRGSA